MANFVLLWVTALVILGDRANGFTTQKMAPKVTDLYSMTCGFETDECGFSDGLTTAKSDSSWRRLCENTAPGCSMRTNAKDSNGKACLSTLLSPWFFENTGVVQMWYRIPDRSNATEAKLGVFTQVEGGNRKLIYLMTTDMAKPWVPMGDEDFERPWVPMSVSVDMSHSLRFRFEIEGYMEDSKEDIYVDEFQFNPNSGGDAFTCKGRLDGLYADSNDCTKYFECSGISGWHRSCGAGTAFNEAMGSCDWPYNVPGCY